MPSIASMMDDPIMISFPNPFSWLVWQNINLMQLENLGAFQSSIGYKTSTGWIFSSGMMN
jgi:hypothetical protein